MTQIVQPQLSNMPPLADMSDTRSALIITDNRDNAEAIATHLTGMNFIITFADFSGKTLRNMPKDAPHIILMALSTHVTKAPAIIKAIKAHFPDHLPPIVGTFTDGSDYLSVDTTEFTTVVFPPAHPAQIATRIDSLLRLEVMELEIIRRIETLSETFGITHALSEDSLTRPYRILFVGKATPEFMVIINALQEKNVEVVAAFTTFTAFDYLHESEFDAVVMNALQDIEPALTISETMRRNSKLYHVPSLFLINDAEFDDHEKAFSKGVRDIIDCNSPTEEISGRILELANYHRIHSQLKKEFTEINTAACLDRSSKTFNAPFFKTHLARVCKDVRSTNQQLGLLTIRVWPNSKQPIAPESFGNAAAQVGDLIKNLVRMQDIVARIENDVYMIAVINENQQNLARIAERINRVIECAAFNTGKADGGTFTVELNIKSTELSAVENTDNFIVRSLGLVKSHAA